VAGHRTRVAQTEIDIPMAVNIEDFRTTGLPDERRKGARPFDHPVHGHAAQQRFPGALKKGR